MRDTTRVQTAEKVEKVVSMPYYQGKDAVKAKLAFASGEITYNFPWQLVSAYLMFFLTDIALVPALVVSNLFLWVRVFDAVNDPIIGLLADRTDTKYGRYKPWLLAGGLILISSAIALFAVNPEWSSASRTWYTIIVYVIAVVGATMWNIPFGGLHASITPDSAERASFASFRILFSSSACAISMFLFLPLANKFGALNNNIQKGYFMAALIICLMAVPFIFTVFFGTKEIVKPPKAQKIEISSLIKTIVQNRPLLLLIFGFFVYGFMAYGRGIVSMYYFAYFWGNPKLMTIQASLGGIITGIAAFFGGQTLLKWVGSKKKIMIVGYVGQIVISTLLFFVITPDKSNPIVLIGLLWLSGAFLGLITCMLYACIPDTVEYGQWKTGIRVDGFIYAGTTFMLKFGGALAPAVLGILLDAAGYIPNVEQTAKVLTTMNVMMNLMPAALSVIGLLLFVFYNLDEKLHAQIVREIGERNID